MNPDPRIETEAPGGKVLASRRELMDSLIETSPHPRRTDRPVVMLVDDDPGVLAALHRCLRREGYELLAVESGSRALERLAEAAVDLVITDQRMPGMKGTELIGEIRRRAPLTRCAILTGVHALSVIREGTQAGASSILFKPWDDRALRHAVRRLLGLSFGDRGSGATSN